MFDWLILNDFLSYTWSEQLIPWAGVNVLKPANHASMNKLDFLKQQSLGLIF
jgi:hypothetical protein